MSDKKANKNEKRLQSNLVESCSDNDISYYSSGTCISPKPTIISKPKPLESAKLKGKNMSRVSTASQRSCLFLEHQTLPPIPTNGHYAQQRGKNKIFTSGASNINTECCDDQDFT